MPQKIALLRGINVGGRRKIKMADLKTLMQTLGYTNLTTYIQSGNILFDAGADTTPDQIATHIKKGIEKEFGFEVPVIVFDKKMLKEAVAQNPFLNDDVDLSKLHLTFLSQKPTAEAQNQLKILETPTERFALAGSLVYLKIDSSFHRTKLSNAFFEKKLDCIATTRNWKTVLKLLEIANS